jgi:hypothetical protein
MQQDKGQHLHGSQFRKLAGQFGVGVLLKPHLLYVAISLQPLLTFLSHPFLKGTLHLLACPMCNPVTHLHLPVTNRVAVLPHGPGDLGPGP